MKFGTGFVGKGTRAKLNALYGCGRISPTPVPTPVATPVATPSLTVTAPSSSSGGFSTWRVGETYIITWQSRGLNYVHLSLETASDLGPIARTIANNVPASNGSYSWTISSEFGGSSGNVFVRSADSGSTVHGVGSANISIELPQPSITVLSPNGGESWVFGNTYTITWKSSGVQTAYVYLAFPDGVMCKITQAYAPYGNIGFAPQKDMQCPGISRTLTAGQYKVAIYGESETVRDFSDAYFSIVSAATSSNLRSIEDQTASIADAVSRLLQSFEEFKRSNP